MPQLGGINVLIHDCTCTDGSPEKCPWCSLTPRERQVHRYEAADAMFQQDVVSMGLAPSHEFALAGLTQQQEKLVAEAIDAFIDEIVKVQPWTGLADLQKSHPQVIHTAVTRALNRVGS